MKGALTSAQRNWSLAMLFAACALNLLDRQIVNILAEAIKSELAINDAQLGLLTGTAFGLFYSILGVPLGRIADRVDRVKLLAGVVVLWSVFTALCGLAGSFLQLLLTRMGVGIGEAGGQPASTALVSDSFPIERRTSAMSVLLVGAPVGSFLGLLLGGYVGAQWGWRAAFLVAGVPGAILGVTIWLTMRDPVRPELRQAPAGSLIEAIRLLATSRRLVWLVVTLICASLFPYASGAWLPSFFMRVHGMTMAEISTYAALAIGVGGGIGTLGSGLLCDALRPRLRNPELKVLTVALTMSLLSLWLTTLSGGRGSAIASMFALNIFAYAFLGPTVTLIQRAATEGTRALAIGVAMALSNVVNLGFAVFAIGLASDALAAAGHGPRSVGYALAGAGLLAASVGLCAHWCLRDPYPQ